MQEHCEYTNICQHGRVEHEEAQILWHMQKLTSARAIPVGLGI